MSKDSRTYKVTEVPAENPDDVRSRDDAYLTFYDEETGETLRRKEVNATRSRQQA